MRALCLHSRTGMSLVEVSVTLVLLGITAMATTQFYAHVARVAKQGEARQSLEQFREFVRHTIDCERSNSTFIMGNGDTSACLPGQENAALRKKDGTYLTNGTGPSRIGLFSVRARCKGQKQITVDVREESSSPTGGTWVPLLRDIPLVCDGAILADRNGWGTPPNKLSNTNDSQVPKVLTDIMEQQKDTSDLRPAFVTLRATAAKCNKYDNFLSGAMNCPAGFHLGYLFYQTSGFSPALNNNYSADSGEMALACGVAGDLRGICSSTYEAQSAPRNARPEVWWDTPLEAPSKPIAYTGRGEMVNTFRTCRGPDVDTTYNAYGAEVTCPVGYHLVHAEIRCDLVRGKITEKKVSPTSVQGTCCGTSGRVTAYCTRQVSLDID